MSATTSQESTTEGRGPDEAAAPRRNCPAPADFQAAIDEYNARAEVGVWKGPRYAIRYRALGNGPPLILCPGLASSLDGYALTLNLLASRFKTVLYQYPGEDRGDGARLRAIRHEDFADDLFGLIDHLRLGRVFLFGMSFGSTVVLRALAREPRRFPKAALQGAFARRRFTPAERLALWVGGRVPGRASRLPLREAILTYNNRSHFPDVIDDRWRIYLEHNGQTPIAPLAHRLGLLSTLDLRPILGTITTETLLLQGNEDRIIARAHFDELRGGLPAATGVIMPLVGHQPHYTHAEGLAQAVGDWFLPCAPGGCPSERPASTEGPDN